MTLYNLFFGEKDERRKSKKSKSKNVHTLVFSQVYLHTYLLKAIILVHYLAINENYMYSVFN